MQARSGGFTLLELMVGIGVLAILLTVGLPSYQSLRENNALVGAASTLSADIQLARSEAVKRNSDDVSVVFFPGSNWCYRITDNASCTGCAATCDIAGDGITRGGDSSLFAGVTLADSDVTYADDTLDIGARRATMEAGHVIFGLSGKQIEVKTSNLGRVRYCTPSGSSLSGVSTCD